MPIAVSTDSAKRALLERLIDDAGLFPPAELPMRAALRHHVRHAESAYWWVSGRFVVPASRLDEFAAARAASDGPIDLSVILDAGSLGAKGDTVRADLHRIDRVAALDGVTVSSLEAKLPQLTLDGAAMQRIVADIVERYPSAEVAFWYESGYDAGWTTPLESWLTVLANARAAAPANVTLGAKVRCGGTAPGATPSVPDLAEFVAAAHAHDVPWKATAGLHHPVRGAHGVAGGVVPHGFLNLFIAGAALHAGVLDAARVADVLAEEDPLAFVVDPAHVSWRDVRIEPEQIAAARERCVAFGSCSFAEPVNDLREFGILS
ncbi:MAG: hypothetical protein QOJ39_1131 [Candidatus Eremiobacteraeota bacterium]|jgi:hypothetical protein|nr:hypothetical protein [Candidatus Eremiobacteraeota bacterium]